MLEEIVKNIQENTVSRTAIRTSKITKKELRCSWSNKCYRGKRDNVSGQFARADKSESESHNDVDGSSTVVKEKLEPIKKKRQYTKSYSWTKCNAHIVIKIMAMGTKPKHWCICGQDCKFESRLVLHKQKCPVVKSFMMSSGNFSCKKCGLCFQTKTCLDKQTAVSSVHVAASYFASCLQARLGSKLYNCLILSINPGCCFDIHCAAFLRVAAHGAAPISLR